MSLLREIESFSHNLMPEKTTSSVGCAIEPLFPIEIPVDVMYDILMCLSPEELAICCVLNRAWYNLLNSPDTLSRLCQARHFGNIPVPDIRKWNPTSGWLANPKNQACVAGVPLCSQIANYKYVFLQETFIHYRYSYFLSQFVPFSTKCFQCWKALERFTVSKTAVECYERSWAILNLTSFAVFQNAYMLLLLSNLINQRSFKHNNLHYPPVYRFKFRPQFAKSILIFCCECEVK